MLYKSIKSADFLPDENFDSLYAELQQAINKYINSGYLQSFDGLNLYYEYFLCENAVGNVVIVHGLSEFTKKFHELAMFFLNNRYNVFIYDQRGHGYSGRQTDNLEFLFVKSYKDYVTDLEYIIDNVVKPVSSLPITIYSQSMGGAVTGLYLQKHPTDIKEVVFSAPMLCPWMNNTPRFLARFVARLGCFFQGEDKPFLKVTPFSPKSVHHTSTVLSKPRFKTYMKMRIDDKRYQMSQLTNRWVEQTTRVQKWLLNKKRCKNITTRCLILSAEKDTIVLEKPQREFSKLLPDCKFVTIKGAKHTIFGSTKEVMEQYFSEMRKFLGLNDNQLD